MRNTSQRIAFELLRRIELHRELFVFLLFFFYVGRDPTPEKNALRFLLTVR